jgi:hypothetical protein
MSVPYPETRRLVVDDKLLNRLIGRGRALRFISEALADRTHFLLVPPVQRGTEVAELLDGAGIPWTGYIDSGQDTVLRVDQASLMMVTEQLARRTAALITVAKTVPAEQLSSALDQAIAADGSQDLILMTDDGKQLHWPMLFVDALDRIDPVEAARLRAAAGGPL